MTIQEDEAVIRRSEIVQHLVTALEDSLSLQTGVDRSDIAVGENTPLIGCDARVDSLGLVTMILDVEQRLEEDYGIVMVIASDRAMSQSNSPFRTISLLADYICSELKQDGCAVEE